MRPGSWPKWRETFHLSWLAQFEREFLLDWAVRHELGHAIRKDPNEQDAARYATWPESTPGKPLPCGPAQEPKSHPR